MGDLRATNGVRTVHRVFEHDVRVARLELDLGEYLEEVACADLLLRDAVVVHHFAILFRHVDVRERLAIDPLDVVRREQVHGLVVLRDVGDDDAEGEGLDADLLIGILALRVKEAEDVGVVRVEVHGTGTLACTELVRVTERILQELHDGDDARRLVLDLLDGCAVLAEVRQQEGHAAATLGKLKGGVDRTTDRLHVVLDTQEEARHELAALRLARVEEGRGRGLETPVENLVDDALGERLIAGGEGQGDHAHAILESLEVALAVERLEGVRRVVLKRAKEGGEAELLRVRALVQRLDELERVLVENVLLVVLLLDEVVELFLERVEEDRVLVDVLEEVFAGRLAVLVELDLAVRVVQVQHGVERVVVHRLVVLVARHLG